MELRKIKITETTNDLRIRFKLRNMQADGAGENNRGHYKTDTVRAAAMVAGWRDVGLWLWTADNTEA